MNKHHNFWLDRWQKNDIPFHQQQVNPDLPRFWPQLGLPTNSRILVPLCGKSLDMLWLHKQGHYIIGIELSSIAVEHFFRMINIPYQIIPVDNIQVYKADHFEIWAGDIFQLTAHAIQPVDAIYDRGALIALPHKIRQQYVAHITPWLKQNGKILLKTVAYNQEEMEGPPYSVPQQEIDRLYGSFTSIQRVKSDPRMVENMKLYHERGCQALADETWIITK